MCGIAGVVNLKGSPVSRELIDGMIGTLHHRGPDATGVHLEGPAGLGHARLSIIDLSGGHQPMSNEDGSLWITFNGEIFNYVELKEELDRTGRHQFATRSDTEVILHLYEEKGEDCVRYMNGQWAFAIWDARKRTLFLSRDRVGVRPIFYTLTSDAFVFGSEIKAIFTHPGIDRRLDVAGLDEIFTFWCTLPPRTGFENIHELPPGHSMTVRDGQVAVKPYWRLEFPPADAFRNGFGRSEEEYSEKLLELLVDATRIRLRADVPVGAYLSGGLDSTITTALIRRFTDTPLKSFSVTFDSEEFDERGFQQEAVRYLGTEHQDVRCSEEDIGRAFPDVIRHTEKPIIRTAPVPLFLLSRLVRASGYKVVLTGEGSDEILGGYDIYKEAKIRRFWLERPDSKLRPMLLRKLYPYLQNIQAQPDAYLRAFFGIGNGQQPGPLFSHMPRFDLTAKIKSFFSADVQAAVRRRNPLASLEAELPPAYSGWDPFCQAQYLESSYLLPGYILSSQGDRVAMANSVEGRYPFLDYRVVEFAAQLPPHLKMKVLNEKYLLKRCVGNLIPPSIKKRPKQPYRAPEGRCFFTAGARDYMDELLSPRRLDQDGLFNRNAVARLVNKFKEGQAIGIKDNMALVGIVSTQLVMDQFVRGS